MDNKVIDKSSSTDRPAFPELLGELALNFAEVVHDEIELVIKRTRERVRAVRSGVLTIATGAVIGFAALLSFCAALIIELTYYMPLAIAALVTGTALSFIGILIAFIGYKKLKK